MTIDIIEQENQTVLKVSGWLNTASAPELSEAAKRIQHATSLVLDLENVEYVASAGLRQIVALSQQAAAIGADFSVIHPQDSVMRILKLTGLDRKIRISGSE